MIKFTKKDTVIAAFMGGTIGAIVHIGNYPNWITLVLSLLIGTMYAVAIIFDAKNNL